MSTIDKIEAEDVLDHDDGARLHQLKFWIKNAAQHAESLVNRELAPDRQAMTSYHYFCEARVFDTCDSEADTLALLRELEKTVVRVLEGHAPNRAYFEIIKDFVSYMHTLPERVPY